MSLLEILGYCASGLIVISLMMRSVLKLRAINLLGATSMSLYGYLIGAYPILVLNLIIVCIDLFYLQEMLGKKTYFKLLEVRPNSKYLTYFLSYYESEIKQFLPGFAHNIQEKQNVFFVLRNLVPVGLFISQPLDSDSLLVKLDFVIPGYRDFKVGKFVFSQEKEIFRGKGVRRIYSEPGTEKHESYLHRMGFVLEEQDSGKRYCLKVR